MRCETKRRLFLLILVFPTILAIALITFLVGKNSRARHFAEKWAAKNHGDAVLTYCSFGEISENGTTTKYLNADYFDREHGFFYRQDFEDTFFRYVPTEPGFRSYDTVLDFWNRAEHLASALREAELPGDVICYQASNAEYLMVLTTETDTEALAEICKKTGELALKDGLYTADLLVCTPAARESILSADRTAVFGAGEFSLEYGAGAPAAALLGKSVSCTGTYSGTAAKTISEAAANAPISDGTVWAVGTNGTVMTFALT